MIKFIQNIGDYFSSNYFDEDFAGTVSKKSGYSAEDAKVFQKQISGLKDKYFKYKRNILEGKLRTRDKINETHKFHSEVLNALGYEADKVEYNNLYTVDDKNVLPIRHTLYRGEQPHLMIMEMQPLIKEREEEPDGLFEQQYNVEEEDTQTPPQKYHRSQWKDLFTVPDGMQISPMIINKAVSQLFLMENHRRPKYVLLCAGNVYYLLEQEKWFRGSYLQFDLEHLFDEASIKRDYYSLFYFLIAKENLAPLSDIVLMEQLDEDSHKSAYAVTQDLKTGVIHAVEAIANEAVWYWKSQGNIVTDINADTLKDECLNYVYRLLFLFYAESREDLDILPSNDQVYENGYSLEMLRDLEQVPLNTASSQDGFFFHESLTRLFKLLSSGYREKENSNRSFKIRRLDSPLFDDNSLSILPQVKLRNLVWQDVICQLSLSKKQKGKARGRISYANLGINQLGSVYESLLAFRGFFAESDTIEVHKKRKAKESSQKVVNNDGSYLVPRHRIDDFDPLEVYRDANDEVRIIPKGTFIYRLSGRDRQKSASYYTPEVLTQCTVKYTLKPILEKLDEGKLKAKDLLDLKILEPAMGAAAFHNEVINQLADAYLQYRQIEKKEKVAPDKYREETQKVKAYIALNNVYGVDLNPTAVELGKLSLWLNVIHKDMETPFFGYRLGTGNAVVGAWLKVFNKKDILLDPNDRKAKKDWWNKAPKHLKFIKKGIQRKKEEIYHFLLPDKGMVPSAKIKLLKDEFPDEAKAVSDWEKEFCKPISNNEYPLLQKIASKIDALLEEHYQHQRKINKLTSGNVALFGVDAPELGFDTYAEKEKLAAERFKTNAPYFKLKMIMDYWCSLWFWDVRDAADLPTRLEWWQDIANILQVDLNENNQDEKKEIEVEESSDNHLERKSELTLFDGTKGEVSEVIIQYGENNNKQLFKTNRLRLVNAYTEKYLFFHYQLEFVEVFRERGGFDVIAGNPPWVNIEFDVRAYTSEFNPIVEIQDINASQLKKIVENIMKDNERYKIGYISEVIETHCVKDFLKCSHAYSLLDGQRNNLYKCILVNSHSQLTSSGSLGLLHPEGIYDDPNAENLRKIIYKSLRYHFQFQNEFKLFSEIGNRVKYGINIYSQERDNVNFYSINNLFSVSTIDSSLIHNGKGIVGGIKIFDDRTESWIWNIKPHKRRVIHHTASSLEVLSKNFETNKETKGPKLISLHDSKILSVLGKIGNLKGQIGDLETVITDCWRETDALNNGDLLKVTKYVNIQNGNFVLSGPHFFVGNPMYQSPREICNTHKAYATIDLQYTDEKYTPRTNFTVVGGNKSLESIEASINNSPWISHYKLALSEMISLAGERSLQAAIIPPNISHLSTVRSITFANEFDLIQAAAIFASLPFDYLIKVLGRDHITLTDANKLPFGVQNKFLSSLINRGLLLNCLNFNYTNLWERNYQEKFKSDNWSKDDSRLKPYSSLVKKWKWETPLRNWFERRQALVEIDVITAMALGLTLNELILICNVQFPVLQQNEDDTWYDTKGNIVFTCSKGINGIGLNRQKWNTVKEMKAGETYEHTIEKNELYKGQKVTYTAPFDKCDRVEDYKVAWKHFEEVFKKEEVC